MRVGGPRSRTSGAASPWNRMRRRRLRYRCSAQLLQRSLATLYLQEPSSAEDSMLSHTRDVPLSDFMATRSREES